MIKYFSNKVKVAQSNIPQVKILKYLLKKILQAQIHLKCEKNDFAASETEQTERPLSGFT